MHLWAVFVAMAAATGSLVFFKGSKGEHIIEGSLAVGFAIIAGAMGIGLMH